MTTVQMVARQVPYWTTVYRRTWRGDAPVTSVVQRFAPGRQELVARFGARS